MFIGSCVFNISIVWAKSLKDKRQCIKSIIDKSKHKFNISIAEIGENDSHNYGVIGFCCISNSKTHADTMIWRVMDYIESITEGEIFDIDVEII